MNSISLNLLVKNIQKLLDQRGITASDLARMTKFDRSYLGKLMRGEVEPGIDKLDAIAHAFRVPPWKLLDDGTIAPTAGAMQTIEEIAKIALEKLVDMGNPTVLDSMALGDLLPEERQNVLRYVKKMKEARGVTGLPKKESR